MKIKGLSILLVVIFLFINSNSLLAQDRLTGKKFTTRSEVLSTGGMVATSHPIATQIGLDILREGGNAIDAAIAANAALGLMEPTGSGIGGDLFAIVWSARDNKLYGLNGSGRSPQDLTLEYFREKGMDKIPATGPLPVSVPGCVDGWFTLHEKFGSKSMKEILSPVIRNARDGFPVTEVIGMYLSSAARSFRKYPNFAEIWMPEGRGLRKGDVFKNPYLASTYEKIANEGRDAFYKGEIAETIANFIQEQGGFLSEEDLANHRSEWVDPVSTNYRGYDVWELPPNGQGIAALQILNIMEGFDVKEMGFGTAEYVHHFVEAKKLAFEDRAKYYSDPAFNELPINKLISKDYADERRQLIKPDAAMSYEAGEFTHGETIYLTVADQFGNMVSLIQSNYRGMGSGMVPPKLGFMLQDRGELFSLEEGHFNVYEPGKRPFHTIIPAFITKDGKPLISFGLMGGSMQPQGHAQVVMNLVDFGMNLQEIGDAPRIRHGGSSQPTGSTMTDGGKVYLESGYGQDVIDELKDKGHNVGRTRGGYGGYQAIKWDAKNKVYYGASESRKDGNAAGIPRMQDQRNNTKDQRVGTSPLWSSSKSKMKYLALGDSYTIGESIVESDRWPVLFVKALREKGVDIDDPRIIAKTGWTTDELKNAIINAKIDETYNLVSLSIGVNNQYRGRNPEEFRREYAELLDMAIEFAGNNPDNVIVLSIPHWGLTPFAKGRDRDKIVAEIEVYNVVKKEETLKRGVGFIDITEVSRKATKDKTYTAKDGLHYSGKMHGLWVDEIIKARIN